VQADTVAWQPIANFMIQALTGVENDFRPDGGIASFPPGDHRDFGRRSFLAPVNVIMD
jgi:hypothetical protein